MFDQPTESQIEADQTAARQPARRRHLLRWGLGLLGAGALARAGTRSAQAANGDPVVAGQTVTASGPTTVQGTVSANPALRATNAFPGTTDALADGVQGYAAGANNAGLFGRNNDLDGIGVSGAAPNGVGVFGESAKGTGVGARSATGQAICAVATGTGTAVLAVADAAGATALYGHATSLGYAGIFQGYTYVAGTFTVNGVKSAAVPHPDGSLRRLYCLESPESYFEDFGRANLASGRASVRLDADFMALVHADEYFVFLTPEGDTRGLYVASRTPSSFEVRELGGGTASLPFTYRVLARRKDILGPRLERVEPPRPPDGMPPVPGPVPAATVSLTGPAATATGTPTPTSPTGPTATASPTPPSATSTPTPAPPSATATQPPASPTGTSSGVAPAGTRSGAAGTSSPTPLPTR